VQKIDTGIRTVRKVRMCRVKGGIHGSLYRKEN